MSKGYEKRVSDDGSENPKYIDLLEEDKPISGQKFVCVSFVSPENILKQKNIYFFEEFLKHFDLTKSIEKFTQFLNFISYKHEISFEPIMEDFKEFLKSEKSKLVDVQVLDDYKNFLDAKEDSLADQFNITNNFQTSVRGLKIRGSYSTQQEAELRAKLLREIDPNHNVYVGPVGMWMPWEPEAYKTGRVEYMEDELNQLMKEKNENEKHARDAFEKRVKETKRKAIEENKKKALETGNKLTQNINEQGELVGVANMSTIEKSLGEGDVVSSADIRRELFEGENVRTSDKPDAAEEYKKRSERNNITAAEAAAIEAANIKKRLDIVPEESTDDKDDKEE